MTIPVWSGDKSSQTNPAHLGPHLRLLLLEPLLLVTDDGAGPADPQPGDGLHGGPPPVLHHVAANQRPRPAQTSLAVHYEIERDEQLYSSL